MADQASRDSRKTWTVPAERDGSRLDGFVRNCLPELSRQSVQAAIAAGLFRVNGRHGRKGDRVVAGDTVSFEGPENWLADAPLPAPHLPVSILYEDAHVLVLDKPAGTDTHGFSGRHINTIANFVAAKRPEILGVGRSRWEPGLVHRLDRETSGLLLIAKTQPAFDRLRAQFRERRVKKSYWALVWGITPVQGSIADALAHDRHDKRRMQVILPPSRERPKGWAALTKYRRLETHGRFSLLELEMQTGVTHQIRAHLANVGYPIVGDSIYGLDSADSLGLKRHFLHAFRLEFHHPEDRRKIVVESPLPAELQRVLNSLQVDG